MALVLIAGATQSGKGAIAEKLQQQGFNRIAVHTDAVPVAMTPYVHVSPTDMVDMFDQGLFVEFNRHAGQAYGLTKKELIKAVDSEQDQVIILSPSGVAKIRKYLAGNNIPHLCVFISVPVITLVERLTEKLKNNSLSEERFIHKMASLAQVERDWSREAYTGNAFDIVYEEVAAGRDLDSIVGSISNHIKQLNSQHKRMAKKP